MGKKKLLIVICLLLLVGFNYFLYRAEFNVLIDPNDNIFQYALIDEARNIWSQIWVGKLSPMYLFDSWNERWAEGFALTSYYSHVPQAILGLLGGYKLFVIVRTLMLIGLPIMFFWGARIMGVSRLASLLVSFLSQVIFTDGLYGIDAPSFVWRGWGLSAQLMAVFFLPVAFAYSIDYLEHKRNLGKAILFNFLVASSHFGIFSLVLLGYGLYWPFNLISWDDFKYQILNSGSKTQQAKLKDLILPSLILIGSILFSVAYFIIPFFFQGDYRNYSIWDPIWKFDSWGLKQIFIWFLNGDLFDFNRLPVITLSVLFGLFAGLTVKNKLLRYFSILFVFYFSLFLGRATLGRVIDLIPGFAEFHQHRMIVMVQFAGLFLGARFIDLIFRKIAFASLSKKVALIVFMIFLLIYLEKPLVNYVKDNGVWIERANAAYQRDLPDYERIKSRLANLKPARVYVGRPGNWGKQFTVGETPLYMVLSRDGYPTIGFLPESWSMNSDPEQFFDENDSNFYNLYNIRYGILPDNVKPPEFATLIVKEGKYNLYAIETEGWFVGGTSNIAIKTKKTNLLNPTRLWFESQLFKQGDYPRIDFAKAEPDGKRWYIEMTDKNNWINLNDGIKRNLWKANPFSADLNGQTTKQLFLSNQEKTIKGYKVRVEVKNDCKNCIVILKQSFHPNWQVMVNGEKIKAFPVMPFYLGVALEKAGNYDLQVEYKPNNLKTLILIIEIIGLVGLILLRKDKYQRN